MANIKIFFILIIVLLFNMTQMYSQNLDYELLMDQYDQYRSIPKNLMFMKHKHVVAELNQIQKINSVIKVENVGNSVENRSINLVSFGNGKTKILLWSQMHGNEPTATAALLAIYRYFAQNINEPFVQNIKNQLSINALIMLNPDGAERFQRRNAYDIDINRDAKRLQSPEGKILKAMQQRIKPDFGFNLHDMGGRETVEGTDNILKIALMAPPFNTENEDNPTRIKAKKVAVLIKSVLDNYIQGHIAKYKADYMPRAFGDAMQFWGVSTVLIETGSYTGDDPIFLEKLNFIALLSVFDVLAQNQLNDIDENKYDEIPLEGTKVFDLLIKNVLIVNGEDIEPFEGDVGINIDFKLNDDKIDTVGYIKDIGDLSIYNAKQIIEEENMILTPGFIFQNHIKLETSELQKNGITTIVTNKRPEGKREIIKKVAITDIPKYTSLAAKKFKIEKKGIIKRTYQADLLIFKSDDSDSLKMENLKYVIVNGIIK